MAAPAFEPSSRPVLEVNDLQVAFPTARGVARVVRGASFELRRGEMLGLVGESGAGKSVLCRSLIGLTPPPGEVIHGDVRLDGANLLQLPPRRLQQFRGSEIAMVFQDPATALDPVLSVGTQLVEVIRASKQRREGSARKQALALLERVGIPNARNRLQSYPHELSGGMRQRVAIALAVAGRPRILLADEPTTALDVTVQAQILALLRSLQEESGISVVLVSHDLGVVAQNCDRVAVMYGGHIVELAPTARLFDRPRHPYTHALIRSLLPLHGSSTARLDSIPGQPPSLLDEQTGCPFVPRCELATEACRTVSMNLVATAPDHLTACPFADGGRATVTRLEPHALRSAPAEPGRDDRYIDVAHVTKRFHQRGRLLRSQRTATPPALSDVSLTVPRGSAIGIVGESGSGKTTLARCIVGLERPDSGTVRIGGVDVAAARQRRLREVRRHIQVIFQDPYASLNPRLSVGDAIYEAGRIHGRATRADREPFVDHLLEQVGLPGAVASMRPRRLSGGQRQRVAIARALAVGADTLIADEAVSALDVSVQAQVLNLFSELRDELGLTLLFISHQLAVISHVCDSVAVMYLGQIVEFGAVDQIFRDPQHPYTQALIAAHPDPDPTRQAAPQLHGELADGAALGVGCSFRTRCVYAVASCATVTPTLQRLGDRSVACDVLPFQRDNSRQGDE